MKISCKICGKEFVTYPSRIKRKYCSPECYHKAHSTNMRKKYWSSPEYIKRLSKAREISTKNRGRTYEEIYGIDKAREIKLKLKESHKGQYHSLEQRTKVSQRMKGHPYWGLKKRPPESCLKTSNSLKGRKLSIENKHNIGLANKRSIKKLWQNQTYRNQQVRLISNGWRKSPTKPERQIIDLVEKHNLPFKYNGYNGSVIIGGKIPDFVSTTSKMVIEVFGRLFHDPQFPRHLSPITENKTFDGTTQHYERYGYKCLILWEDEIQNSLSAITSFLERT